MADPEMRWPENTPGRFFVDESCIDCDLCRTTAPANFERNPAGHSFVARQPATPEEEKACKQALLECPVEAIGEPAAHASRAGLGAARGAAGEPKEALGGQAAPAPAKT